MAPPPRSGPPEPTPFLSRWSQRKRLSDTEPLEAPSSEKAAVPSPEPDDSISEEELAALPALEDLTFGTDIRPFLRKGVPHALRNGALRKMWLLTPAIRDYKNPAVDYAWDWNTPGGVPGDGAAPSPERAAQMLRDLFAPRGDAAKDEESETLEGSRQTVDGPSTDAAVQNVTRTSPAPERIEGVSDVAPESGKAAAPGAKNLEKQSAIPDTFQRRRHGGALPG